MPPPVHGAAMVGQWIHDSKLINKLLNVIILTHLPQAISQKLAKSV